MAKVYSTEFGKLCPKCGAAEHDGRCANAASAVLGDGKVRIQRETKGRKGAGVTLVTGVPLAEKEMKLLHKTLKKKCGVGGALKNGVMELQGDQRETLLELLSGKGWDVKVAGG
ncbi:MAG: stress response translation initiation inhibitor YciH [Sinobacterium sp.]|nr:stress response translation initiation inhibitor YciH [Sinobacterium sp.]